jgi:hypothetical protein
MARQLGPGDKFPEYLVPVVGDRSLQLLTRSSWRLCSHSILSRHLVTLLCSAGRRLSGHIEEFKQENIDVVALSVDPLDKAQEMVERALVPPFPSATG